MPPLLYITLPFTGVFNMAEWLPQRWREAALWSPLVNNIEMLRAGMFSGDIQTYYYPLYSMSLVARRSRPWRCRSRNTRARFVTFN